MNPPATQPVATPPATRPPGAHVKVIWACIITIALGVVIFFNYMMKLRSDQKRQSERPAFKGELRHNLAATEMSGKSVDFGMLDGKVWVCGFLYTQCPRGCDGLAERMKSLQDQFSANPRFHLVSVSLNAEVDTAERLREWTAARGYKGDNWWFLTGDPNLLRGYMKDEFKLTLEEVPEQDRSNPYDKWYHKLALVLVDHKRRIRGAYDFSDATFIDVYERNIIRDIKIVLEEAEKESPK